MGLAVTYLHCTTPDLGCGAGECSVELAVDQQTKGAFAMLDTAEGDCEWFSEQLDASQVFLYLYEV